MIMPNPELCGLVRDAWNVHALFAAEPFLVRPSIPILFFGDSERYFASSLKVVTVGLNPSGAEFPEANRFLRFSSARGLYPGLHEARFVSTYLQTLNEYFQEPPGQPYRRWFHSLEPLLNGLDCSFYGTALHTALHTDICSPLATSPTWNGLSPQHQLRLMESGTRLWHSLIEWLSPDLIIASVARSHLGRIAFVREGGWRVIRTIPQKNPYQVEVSDLRLPGGKLCRLVFGKAANVPFGTVSNIDKGKIGNALRDDIAHGIADAANRPVAVIPSAACVVSDDGAT